MAGSITRMEFRKDSNWFKAVFLWGLSILLGFVVAFVLQVLKTPIIVKEMPSEENRREDEIYYLIGSSGESIKRQNEVQAFLDQQFQKDRYKFYMEEQDLNSWSKKMLKEKGYKGIGTYVSLSIMNFAIRRGELYVTMKLNIRVMNRFEKAFLVLTKGILKRERGHYIFDIEDAYLGSARIPMGEMFLGKSVTNFVTFFSTKKYSEAFLEAWRRNTVVSIKGDRLILVKN